VSRDKKSELITCYDLESESLLNLFICLCFPFYNQIIQHAYFENVSLEDLYSHYSIATGDMQSTKKAIKHLKVKVSTFCYVKYH
jgi:hypothetical protein